jgi:hypothetical protein
MQNNYIYIYLFIYLFKEIERNQLGDINKW